MMSKAFKFVIIGVCLVVLVALLVVGFKGCMKNLRITEESVDKVGGHCIYSRYPGVIVVTRIEKTEESKRQARKPEGPGYEGYEVWFVFETDQEINNDWAHRAVAGEHLFHLANGCYPGPEYLEKYHIKVGSSYRCALKVIKSGTCTPIIFEFDQLKIDDYFESS